MRKVETVVERVHVNFPLTEVVGAEVFSVGVVHLCERHTHGDFLPRVAVCLRGAGEHGERVRPLPRVYHSAADAVNQRGIKLVLQLGAGHERRNGDVHIALSRGWDTTLVFRAGLIANHVQ